MGKGFKNKIFLRFFTHTEISKVDTSKKMPKTVMLFVNWNNENHHSAESVTSSSSSIQTHSRSGSFDEPEEPFNGRRNISSWIGRSSEVKKKKKRIRSRLLTIDQLLYG